LDFVLGTPDGIVPDSGRGLEVKTCAFKNQDWGKPGSDEVPVHYLLQCAQYMAITGLDTWDLAVLFSGNRLEIYTLHRNREMEGQIINAATWFWKTHVEPRVPPPIDGSESCSRYLAKKYLIGNQTYIDATPDIELEAHNLMVAQLNKKVAIDDENKRKNLLAEFIGENKGCYFPDGSRAQWIRPKPSTVMDWESYASTVEAAFGMQAPERTQFEIDRAGTPYIRLYEATANQKRLKGKTA
jgi:predicted phage-related endonuclease